MSEPVAARRAAPAGMGMALALVMAGALALYLVLAGDRAVRLIASGELIGIVTGIALLVFFVVGAWALGRELVFGAQLHRAVRELDAQGGMPLPLPAMPSGRADREAAEGAFPIAKADVEAHPESWQSWLRLSMAYDAARDRKRARMAARKALALRRAAGSSTEAQEAP
ncbi:hypothetical protein AA0Z99_07205 [Agrococcus sp. 1P02AA]|uniref:hypothetical protein n=1 Tax=Agrococcus sp. 1P02AA TaxID=3132259 RepID=UPI0039A459BC